MLTINREFVEHIYRYNVVIACIFDELEKRYGISDIDAVDLLFFLAGKDTFSDNSLPEFSVDGKHLNGKASPSMKELEHHIAEWRASKQLDNETPRDSGGESLANTLSEILGVQLYVEMESEQQRATRQALSDTPEQAGLLNVMSGTIVIFYYLIRTWREKKIYKSKWLNAFETLKGERKHLNRISWLFSKFEKAKSRTPFKVIDYVEQLYNKDYKTVGAGRFIQLFYGRGYVFDETVLRERELAVQWFQSVYRFAKSYQDIIDDIEIMLYKSQEAKIDEPYYAKRRENIDAHLRSCETKWLSEEFEDDDNGDIAQENNSGNSSKQGEIHSGGTWHTSNNTISDLVWAEHFEKCWKKLRGLIIEKIVFPEKYNKGKKKERAVSMLEASMLYKELESNGLARSFWDHGTKSSFVKTLPESADIYRQGLGDYVFLIEIVKRIEELKQENSFYKDTKRTTSGTGLKGGGEELNWKRSGRERLLLTQNPKDLVIELKLRYPDIAAFLTVRFDNHESILSIMNEINNYSWCKNPNR